MSAPIDHRSFAAVEDDFLLCATLWRGAMLDRFARSEALVLKCLISLRDCGFTLSSESFADGAKARLRALLTFLQSENFGGQAKPALRLLRALSGCLDHRPALAHGSMRPYSGELLIEWTCCRGPVQRMSRQIAPTQMLEELAILDKLARDLSSEIGQVVRAAEQRAA